MKNLFSALALLSLVLMISISTAGTKTAIQVTGMDKYVALTIPVGSGTEYVYCGSLIGTKGSETVKFYCVDISHNLAWNDFYDYGTPTTIPEITYILNNYYPFKNNSSALLDANNEAAAIQLALWHNSDNLDISKVTGASNDIITRAEAIIADATLHKGLAQTFKGLVINIPSQSFVIGTPVDFTVETYNGDNNALPNVQVNLSSTNGATFSANPVTTGTNGISSTIHLTAGSGNTTTITATATVIIPGGTQYYSTADANGRQKLILATPVQDTKTVTASVTWYNKVDLEVSKTCASVTVNDGDQLEYVITVKNKGNVNATGVQVTDVLSSQLQFISALPANSYDNTTHIWIVGELAASQTKTLTLKAKAVLTSSNSGTISLGVASDYNLFVLNDLNQSATDTQGKLAVGHDAWLDGYSVGDQLPSTGNGNVLVVGRRLHFASGRVYFGDIAYGEWVDTTHWNLADGKIKKDATPINFANASATLNSISQQLSALAPNGTVTFEYGQLALKGTNTQQNKFLINGSDMSSCNDFTIEVPAGSVVIINVKGDNIDWSGGMELTGAKNENVLFNFYEATNLKISGIEVKASILAPKATLNFPAGLISGQVIVLNCSGEGQFNLVKFLGKIVIGVTLTNTASINHVNEPTSMVVVPFATAQSQINMKATGVQGSTTIPTKFDLSQNYPNPFNPSTVIEFAVPQSGKYSLKVYDVLGRQVAELVNNELPSGNHKVTFDASRLSSGLYIYSLTGSNVSLTKKMILTK